MRSALVHLEDVLANTAVVAGAWPEPSVVRLVLATGAVLAVHLHPRTGDFLTADAGADPGLEGAVVSAAHVGPHTAVYGVKGQPHLLTVSHQRSASPALFSCAAKPKLVQRTEKQPLSAPCVALVAPADPDAPPNVLCCTTDQHSLLLLGLAERRVLPVYEVANSTLLQGPTQILSVCLCATGQLYALVQGPQPLQAPPAACASGAAAPDAGPGARSVHLVQLNDSNGAVVARHGVAAEGAAVACACGTARGDLWAYGTPTHLRLYSVPRHQLTSCAVGIHGAPYLCQFCPSGVLLLVALEHGNALCLFDLGLNAVRLVCGDAPAPSPSGGLPLDPILGVHTRVRHVVPCARDSGRVLLVMERGPLMALALSRSAFADPRGGAPGAVGRALSQQHVFQGLLRGARGAADGDDAAYAVRCLAVLRNVHDHDEFVACLGMLLRAAYQQGHLQVRSCVHFGGGGGGQQPDGPHAHGNTARGRWWTT